MTVAIHTCYVPATATRGSRVKANSHRGYYDGRPIIWSVSVPFDHSGREHEQAAEALRDKYWPGEALTYCGGTLDGKGDVYCIMPQPI